MLNPAQLQRYNDFSTLLCINGSQKFSEEMEHVNYLYSAQVQKLIEEEAIQIKELHSSIHEIEYTLTFPLQKFVHKNIKLMFCVSSPAERKFQVSVFVNNENKDIKLTGSVINQILESRDDA